MRGWRAWYADGAVHDSTRTAVEALPEQGLQIVVVYLAPPYREILHGEFLYWHDGAWGSAAALDAIPPGARVFPGRQIPDAEFEWLQHEALAAVTL